MRTSGHDPHTPTLRVATRQDPIRPGRPAPGRIARPMDYWGVSRRRVKPLSSQGDRIWRRKVRIFTSPPGRGENSRPRTPNAITLALLRETPRKHRETPQKPTVVAPASAGRPPARPVRNPRMSEHGSSGRDVRGAIGGKTPCAQRKPPPHRSASIANSAYAPEGRSAPTAGYAARPHTPREANPTCDDQ